jgi:hypothetical protein
MTDSQSPEVLLDVETTEDSKPKYGSEFDLNFYVNNYKKSVLGKAKLPLYTATALSAWVDINCYIFKE